MRTPRQLVWIAFGGSLTILLAYAPILLRPIIGEQAALTMLLGFLLPIGIAFVVSFVAASKLKDGLLKQRWPDREVESAQDLASSGAFQGLLIVFGLAYFAIAFWSLAQHTHHSSVATCLLLPIMTISRLQTILQPAAKPGGRIDWSQTKPIHSDHWGETS